MTAFEGLADAKELADQLVDYKHKYLAITDKFNCQVFLQYITIKNMVRRI